ncbi:30S ribosomal protein S20 [Candidatus Saccharibacteria bacterium]|nr:30S ribosomal protein S20 [Candidatus Saccharibacteria bacterium]
MPIIKSAKKAARQAVKHTEHNEAIKKAIRAALKDFKKKPTAATLSKIQSEYDKAAKKGLMKKNTVARRKATLHKLAKAAGVKLTTKAAPAKKATAAKPAAKQTAAKKPATKKSTAKQPAAKKPASAPKADKQ